MGLGRQGTVLGAEAAAGVVAPCDGRDRAELEISGVGDGNRAVGAGREAKQRAT